MAEDAEHVGEVDQDLTPSEVDEKLWRVQTSIAAANKESADAVARAAGLIDTRHPEMDLRNAHGALTDAYHELTRAIDVVEKTMDDLDPEYGQATPRQIKKEHAERFEEIYDEPVVYVANLLLEANRREWLHSRPGTQGAESVERHGLTENQRRWLTDLQKAWEEYDG